MSRLDALNAADITKVGVVVVIALVVIGVLLSLVITAIVGRLLVLAVVVVAAILVWQQRTHVENAFTSKACKLSTTFFGIHLDPPQSVRDACTKS